MGYVFSIRFVLARANSGTQDAPSLPESVRCRGLLQQCMEDLGGVHVGQFFVAAVEVVADLVVVEAQQVK